MGKLENIVIVANTCIDGSLELSGVIQLYLKERGIKSSVININGSEENLSIPFNTDLVITLGGDGTVLFVARSVADYGIPILPVNLGTFGYITEVGKDEWQETLEAFQKDGGNISRRLMLRVSVLRDGKKVFSSNALNEAVISSSGIAKVINLKLYLDKTIAGSFRADGMIVATPTGSTGYSLAAGGPILDAEMSALILTPICPFTLSNRPLVTSDKTVTLSVSDNQRASVVLTCDGQITFSLQEKDCVIVEKSRTKMILVHSLKRNFTEIIREKLHWFGEMHA